MAKAGPPCRGPRLRYAPGLSPGAARRRPRQEIPRRRGGFPPQCPDRPAGRAKFPRANKAPLGKTLLYHSPTPNAVSLDTIERFFEKAPLGIMLDYIDHGWYRNYLPNIHDYKPYSTCLTWYPNGRLVLRRRVYLYVVNILTPLNILSFRRKLSQIPITPI